MSPLAAETRAKFSFLLWSLLLLSVPVGLIAQGGRPFVAVACALAGSVLVALFTLWRGVARDAGEELLTAVVRLEEATILIGGAALAAGDSLKEAGAVPSPQGPHYARLQRGGMLLRDAMLDLGLLHGLGKGQWIAALRATLLLERIVRLHGLAAAARTANVLVELQRVGTLCREVAVQIQALKSSGGSPGERQVRYYGGSEALHNFYIQAQDCQLRVHTIRILVERHFPSQVVMRVQETVQHDAQAASDNVPLQAGA